MPSQNIFVEKKNEITDSVFSITALISCGSSGFIPREVPPPQFEEYVYLPIEKLTKEIFFTETQNKYVCVDADFGYIFLYHDVRGFPSDQ